MSQSAERLSNKKLEGIEAEYEAFYGGYWRDISSDFRDDVSKEGNSFVRAIRWDNDGFRSYRNDRGLIIRKKDKSEPQEDKEDIISLTSVFLQSTAISTGISIGAQTFKNILEPAISKTKFGQFFANRPVTGFGAFLSTNKVGFAFTALNFVQDTGQTTSEKLGQAAISLGLGIAASRIGKRFRTAGMFVGPAIGILQGIMQSESVAHIVARTAGHFAGRSAGIKIGGQIFGTSTPTTTPIQGQIIMNQDLIDKVAKQNVKSYVPDTVIQNRRLASLSDALNGKPVSIQKVPQQFKNISKNYKENIKARIRNSDVGTNKAESLKLLANKLRNGRVF